MNDAVSQSKFILLGDALFVARVAVLSYDPPVDRAVRVASVLEAARGLELLSEEGGLKPLDSLNVLDMVMELERLMKIVIPTSMIKREHFESVETVCAWLEQLAG